MSFLSQNSMLDVIVLALFLHTHAQYRLCWRSNQPAIIYLWLWCYINKFFLFLLCCLYFVQIFFKQNVPFSSHLFSFLQHTRRVRTLASSSHNWDTNCIYILHTHTHTRKLIRRKRFFTCASAADYVKIKEIL